MSEAAPNVDDTNVTHSEKEETISIATVTDAVSQAEQDVSMTTSVHDKDVQHKTRRPRTKALLQKLQNQVEFYFSDANISKDRFLNQKMIEHSENYVSVELIASFNKMKSLTTDVNLICQAIKNSSQLELSTDEKLVRRSKPLPSISQSEIDSRTIYVENLPSGINHDKLKKLFKGFGIVTYISLPRHKVSNEIKGFAFIEFSSQDEAQKAVDYFKAKENESVHTKGEEPRVNKEPVDTDTNSGSKEPVDTDTNSGSKEPVDTDTNSGSKEPVDTDTNSGSKEPVDTDTNCGSKEPVDTDTNCGSKEPVDTDTNSGSKAVKRKRNDEDNDTANKKQKIEPPSNTSPAEVNSSFVEGEPVQSATPVVEPVQSVTPVVEPVQSATPVVEPVQSATPVVETITSTESQSLKRRLSSEYSNDELAVKSSRLDSTWSEFSTLEDEETEAGEEKRKKKVRKHKKKKIVAQNLRNLKVLTKNEWLEMKSVFKQMQKEKMQALKSQNKTTENSSGIMKPVEERTTKGFVTNCLVKITYSGETSSSLTSDILKSKCSKYGNVAYMDFIPTSTEGYVRYSESGCVDKLINEEIIEGVKFEALTKEQEMEYYLKTKAARIDHYKSKRKRKTTRGQDKIISKALSKQQTELKTKQKSTHIRFSDSENED